MGESMNNVELLEKVVARQEAEIMALVAETGVNPTVAKLIFLAGVRAASFQAGILCGMGCVNTLKECCPRS